MEIKGFSWILLIFAAKTLILKILISRLKNFSSWNFYVSLLVRHFPVVLQEQNLFRLILGTCLAPIPIPWKSMKIIGFSRILLFFASKTLVLKILTTRIIFLSWNFYVLLLVRRFPIVLQERNLFRCILGTFLASIPMPWKSMKNHWFFKDFVVFCIKDSDFEDFNIKDKNFFESKFRWINKVKIISGCSARTEFV